MRRMGLGAVPWGLLLTAVALVLLLPGLGQPGLFSEAEMPVADRARAALGEALSGLLRSPWFPDWIRTRSMALFGGELGLRLPHALAGAGLVGLSAGVARWRGASLAMSALAGAFAFAFPAVCVAGRTVLGNPIGELVGALAVVAGVAAVRSHARPRAALWAVIACGVLALSVASAGLVLGAVIPLVAIALSEDAWPVQTDHEAAIPPRRTRRVLAAGLGALAVLGLGVAVTMSLRQGDGYIPLLGAAKDLDLLSQPHERRHASALQDFGYQVFPWAGLILAGAIQPRARWPALWAVTAVAVGGGWSLVYGPVPLPVTVPAALCAMQAVQTLLDPHRPRLTRTLVVFLGVAGLLAVRKDAALHPSELVVPQHDYEGEHTFPAQALQAEARLKRIGSWGLLAVILGTVIGRRREDGLLERSLSRIPPRVRDAVALSGFGAATVAGGALFAHVLVPATGAALSLKGLLQRHADAVQAGELPQTLGLHRVRDPGLALYGSDTIEAFQSRRQVMSHLAQDTPAAALVRILDLGPLHQHARQNDWTLHVLDDSHARYRLVANTLPAGMQDRNEIPQVILDAPPQLEHETLVRFEGYVEIIGWEVDRQPLVRGGQGTLRLAMKVLRPLPGGTKLYARFLKGRLSRINGEEHELLGGIYPPNLWRPGDYVLHEFTFDVPPLEILPGTYDFVIGLRRSEHKNFEISLPEGKTGDHGVLIKDRKRNFATIGQVEVF